jgi:tungstate transport system substrate-binding protein
MVKRRARAGAAAGGTALAAAAVVLAACGGGGNGGGHKALIVQSTTSVRDSGVLSALIAPGFRRAHPEYDLKFVAVGSKEAITNARAGQADVLIAHSPPLEQGFVADGYSYEPSGRTIAWNDFVIVGPRSDPAHVGARAPHDAAAAFEAIAAAGRAGRAHFISRGDGSGTNTKELEIWGLTHVPRDSDAQPVRGAGDPRWYVKAGVGMADTLRLTRQCPFPGGGCYTITDRGTLTQLVRNGAISGLPVVMDAEDGDARGGASLMVNRYRAYAINPKKVAHVDLKGARAFLDFLTSPGFQRSLASFPTRRQPGFFPAAFPRVTLDQHTPLRLSGARTLTISGRVSSVVPGAPAPAGMPVRLTQRAGASSTPLAAGRADARGRFRLRARVRRGGELLLSTPRYRDLSPSTRSLGSAGAGAG